MKITEKETNLNKEIHKVLEKHNELVRIYNERINAAGIMLIIEIKTLISKYMNL